MSFRYLSAARSASVTGELPVFIQICGACLKYESAIRPAPSAASRISSRSSRFCLFAGKSHAFDQESRAGNTEIAIDIVGGNEIEKHLFKVGGDGDFAHRVGKFTILDPEPRSTAAIFASNHI